MNDNSIRALLSSAQFVRLWSIGNCVNTMRWFEVLSAALFTLDVTGSGFAVALVSAARTLPMFFLGAFAGVATESVNRKHVLVIGQIVAGCASASVALAAWAGHATPLHIGGAAMISGVVWSTEMATRRRMVGESVPPHLVARALAMDTMSNSFTRLVGPIVAGLIYQHIGIGGCYTFSTCFYALAALLGSGLIHHQTTRRLVVGNVPGELAEGFHYARADVIISGVLLVTFAMNLMAYPYAALVAPIGKLIFHVDPTLVGFLAAAEPFGGFIGGAFLTSREPRISGRILMVGGSLLFLACIFLMPLAPGFWLACLLLAAGGCGSAAFSNMQTSLIVIHAPPHMRSRLMGLLTVCIGMGPIGILLEGTIARFTGALRAIDLVSATGFVAVMAVGFAWKRREAPATAARTQKRPR